MRDVSVPVCDDAIGTARPMTPIARSATDTRTAAAGLLRVVAWALVAFSVMLPNPTVRSFGRSNAARVGEHSAVVWKRQYRRGC